MLGVAHIKDTYTLRLGQKCGQDYILLHIALMDDGSTECFDYYRHSARGACKDCAIKSDPKGTLLSAKV